MAIKIFLPRLGESVEEATIGRWCKEVGDKVERGDVIAELETAKAMMELESPAKGVLLAVFPELGETIPMGELVAIVGKAGEDWESEIGSAKEKSIKTDLTPEVEKTKRAYHADYARSIRISPNAKRVARELGIKIDLIQPKSSGERITADDVRRLANQASPGGKSNIPSRKVILNTIEKITARRMSESARTIPQFSISMEVDVGQIISASEKISRDSGKHITLSALILKAVGTAIKAYPKVNAFFSGEDVFIYQEINIAIAVSTDHGLYVPVIHKANEKPVEKISDHLIELANKCRDRSLLPIDTEGATFTISNLGMMGVRQFVPIIDLSQSAILGVGAVYDGFKVKDETSLLPIKKMTLTLTCDHRVLDGVYAAAFLRDLKEVIECFE